MTGTLRNSKPHDVIEQTAPWPLLHRIKAITEAPLGKIAERLRDAALPFVGGDALVIFTEECTGRPQKKAGAAEVIEKVSITELQILRSSIEGEVPWLGTARIAGGYRDVLALIYQPSNALLVISDPDTTGVETQGSLDMVTYLWRLAAHRIQEKVNDAAPSYLLESRAASAERLKVTSELVDVYSTTLETLLAAARSSTLDDAAARTSVRDTAARALVELRTYHDKTTDLIEEPVASAFERLRDDLNPLTKFSGIEVQFIEPPLNGRALPGEVAIAARAIVRGLLLLIMEQPEVRRIRTQWDCDGENLLINVRDDGNGGMSTDAPAMERLQRRVQALSGRLEIDLMQGWGADIAVNPSPGRPGHTRRCFRLGPRQQRTGSTPITGSWPAEPKHSDGTKYQRKHGEVPRPQPLQEA